MIVVATRDFELYHDLLEELRSRRLTFTTIDPGDRLPDRATILIVGPNDDIDAADIPLVVADPTDARSTVERALVRLRGGQGRLVVGVDPGDRPGIAVIDDDLVIAAFHVPLENAVEVILDAVDGVPNAVVRIGDGARLKGARIINELEGVRVELVDETGTTPALGTGARGLGDVLAAVNIAKREGEAITQRAIEPSSGELAAIQDRSREISPVNREIDTALARRVAAGDMTIEEALERHRDG